MKLLIQNTSDDNLSYLAGAVIAPANSLYEVNPLLWFALINDAEFLKDIRLNNILISDGITSYVQKDALDFVLRIGPQGVSVKTSPFADKVLSNGKKLYTRVHGVSAEVSGAPDNITFTVPYTACKLTGIEIIGGALGDKVNLKILDSTTGTYTGSANYQLNQFGFDVNVAKDFYSRESAYDADLFLNMQIRVEYDSVAALPANVYINFILHEVKD